MSDDACSALAARRIVHDLNNLFAAISGFATLLVDDLEPGTPAQTMATKILNGQIEAEALVAELARMLRRDARVNAVPHTTSRSSG